LYTTETEGATAFLDHFFVKIVAFYADVLYFQPLSRCLLDRRFVAFRVGHLAMIPAETEFAAQAV
jgi:hypothetical protein